MMIKMEKTILGKQNTIQKTKRSYKEDKINALELKKIWEIKKLKER